MGFFRQHVPESRTEHYRVRYVNIFYYLEDDTITVIEPIVKVDFMMNLLQGGWKGVSGNYWWHRVYLRGGKEGNLIEACQWHLKLFPKAISFSSFPARSSNFNPESSCTQFSNHSLLLQQFFPFPRTADFHKANWCAEVKSQRTLRLELSIHGRTSTSAARWSSTASCFTSPIATCLRANISRPMALKWANASACQRIRSRLISKYHMKRIQQLSIGTWCE